MELNSNNKETISRRKVLPFIGVSLLIPFFGFPYNKEKAPISDKEKYQTLLKSDGTTVLVKESSLKSAKILKKNISNNSFLTWLGRNK